jgi:hypothetical protein
LAYATKLGQLRRKLRDDGVEVGLLFDYNRFVCLLESTRGMHDDMEFLDDFITVLR